MVDELVTRACRNQAWEFRRYCGRFWGRNQRELSGTSAEQKEAATRIMQVIARRERCREGQREGCAWIGCARVREPERGRDRVRQRQLAGLAPLSQPAQRLVVL